MARLGSTFLLVVLFVLRASGQTATGTITGSVTDDTGGVLAGARVIAFGDKGYSRNPAFTSDSGNYSIPNLPVGEYRVEAEYKGFKRFVLTNVIVEVEHRTHADMRLMPGPISESIEVRAEKPLLQTDEASVGGSIGKDTIRQVPLNGRMFEWLSQLFTGVVLPANLSHLAARGGFNGIGIDEHYNLFLIDGIDNGDPVIRNWAFRPSIDQIDEFKLIEAGIPAQFGRSAGVVVSVTTLSGTNQFHGSAWEFFRNHHLDARNYIAPANLPAPPFNRNQFGATLGGPIRRNKTFFFGSYEGLRSNQGISRLATVPTELMRSGDLSELGAANVAPSEFHPLAQELLQAFPLPNLPGIRGNRAETANRIENGNDYSLRIDHWLFENTWIFARFSSSVTQVLDPFRTETGGSANLAGFGQTADRTRISGGFNAITATPQFVNELRFGYSRVQQPLMPLNKGTGQEPLMGFEKAFLDFSISGFDMLGSGAEFKRAVNVYNYVDTVSISTGNHQIKTGIDVRRYLFNSYIVSPNAFSFDGSRTGNAFADFLRGLPSVSVSQAGSPGGNPRKTELAWFVQDDWKASRRLTLSYGLRWEYYGRILERTNKQSLWLAECNCMGIAGDALPEQLVDNDFNNFAPRLGLAFRPSFDPKAVIRVSGGIHYDNDMRHNSEVIMNPPFFQTDLYLAPMFPSLSLDNPFPSTGIASVTPITLDRHYRDTYAETWSFGFQREMPSRTLLELTYIGNHVVKARRLRNLNQPVDGVPPFSGFSRIMAFEQAGNSNYHALQARLERRFYGGFGFISSYTWGHAIDDRPGQGGGTVQNNLNLRSERSDADFDVRHRWTISSVWDIPFGRGRRWGNRWTGLPKALAGGWTLSVIGIAQSGRPLNITLTSNNSGSGNLMDRPDAVAGVDWRPVDQRPDHWINPAAFTIPTAGTFGNLGRNAVRGPGIQNVDVSLSKTQHLGDELRVQFRAELFNALNRPNFAAPATQLDAATTFGVISSTVLPQRQIQIGIRLDY